MVDYLPFEGEITTKNQLFKLIYQRLKYIIEDKINNDKVNPVRSRGKDCRFRVNVFLAVAGEIKDEALERSATVTSQSGSSAT